MANMADPSSTTPPSTPPHQTFLASYADYSPPRSLKSTRGIPEDDSIERMQLLTLGESEQEDTIIEMRHPRPYTPRSAAETLPSPLLQPSQFPKPRNRSPYSRSHLRSQSSTASLTAPPMTRAHSSPAFSSPQLSLAPAGRSSSPLRSPKRNRSPFRASSEEYYQGSSAVSDIESIDEDHELDITPRPAVLTVPDNVPSLQLYGNTFPRRRRPASPLYHVSSTSGISAPTSAPTSAAPSPLLSAQKFNEAFPSDFTYSRSFSSISSMPSTPTSARSRSPSISSLETIPDTPDEEAEATEAEKVERLRRASENNGDSFRRPSLDSGRGGAGIRDKRKRWSVCGAEKRSDLNLETIWEDGS